MFSSLATATSGNGGQFSNRSGKVDRIILHHCASTSIFAVLDMMKYGTREVSANYVIGNEGQIVGVVPEEYRAWTSGSAAWDGRAITFEIVNETAGPEWRISAKAFDAVARMLADLSTRYRIVLSRNTVITHQELYTNYGASYPTACPGPYLQARIDELIALAKKYMKLPAAKATNRSISMLGMFCGDGEGRYGDKGGKYWATFDPVSKTVTYLTQADATAVSSNMGTSFANLTYAGWEGYHAQANEFIDATVAPPKRVKAKAA